MKIRPKEVKRVVGILTDPRPSFMSLVDHGANQVPWNVVKHARKPQPKQETSEMTVKSKRRVKAAPTKKSVASKSANTEAKLVSLQFSKTQYPDEESVRKYLDKMLDDDQYEIEDDDDVFVAKSTEDFSGVTLGKARSTATKSAGITAFIAPVMDDTGETDEDEQTAEKKAGSKVKTVDGVPAKKGAIVPDESEDEEEEEEETSEDGDEAEEGDESEEEEGDDDEADAKGKKPALKHDPLLFSADPVLAAKFDWWGAYASGDQSIAGVIKDGMGYDALPPGIDEVMFAAGQAMGNILGSDDESAEKKSKLAQLGAELGTFAFGLFELFEQAGEDSTKSVNAKRRKSAKTFLESFAASVEKLSDNVIGDEEDETEDETPAPKPKAKTVKAKDAKGDEGMSAILKRIGAVEEVLARSTTRKGMSESLAELGIEDEEDEADAEEATIAKSDMRRALGGRP